MPPAENNIHTLTLAKEFDAICTIQIDMRRKESQQRCIHFASQILYIVARALAPPGTIAVSPTSGRHWNRKSVTCSMRDGCAYQNFSPISSIQQIIASRWWTTSAHDLFSYHLGNAGIAKKAHTNNNERTLLPPEPFQAPLQPHLRTDWHSPLCPNRTAALTHLLQGHKRQRKQNNLLKPGEPSCRFSRCISAIRTRQKKTRHKIGL